MSTSRSTSRSGQDRYTGPLRPLTTSVRAATLAVAVGALAVSTSAIFIELSGASSTTSSVLRCALAVPLVAVAGRWEPATPAAAESTGQVLVQRVVCGALFAGDMVWWSKSITEIGAGLATVLVNAQVVIVPALAWLFDRERPDRRYFLTLPVLAAGVALAGGAVGGAGGGSNPAAGIAHGLLAAASYSGFLFLLRRLGATSAVRTYRDTLMVAAAVTVLVGLIGGSLTFALDWRAWLWLVLVAVVGQAPGWLLVAVGSPELRPHNAATLLLLTPIGALVLSVVVLHERPTGAQLLGCCLVLAGVLIQSGKKT